MRIGIVNHTFHKQRIRTKMQSKATKAESHRNEVSIGTIFFIGLRDGCNRKAGIPDTRHSEAEIFCNHPFLYHITAI